MQPDGCCPKRVSPPRAPDGWTVEAMRGHPTYRHYLDLYAQCQLEAGHAGAHRVGGLLWHDPPVVIVGGREQ